MEEDGTEPWPGIIAGQGRRETPKTEEDGGGWNRTLTWHRSWTREKIQLGKNIAAWIEENTDTLSIRQPRFLEGGTTTVLQIWACDKSGRETINYRQKYFSVSSAATARALQECYDTSVTRVLQHKCYKSVTTRALQHKRYKSVTTRALQVLRHEHYKSNSDSLEHHAELTQGVFAHSTLVAGNRIKSCQCTSTKTPSRPYKIFITQ